MFISIGSNAHSQNASDIFKEASKCTGLISDGKNFGSGFFINKNTFVTNYHVINHLKENNIEIRAQGSVFSIDQIIEVNKTVDLALIRVSDSSENYFRIANPLEIKVGQTVYAIGNPTSIDEKVFKNTFTNGIINNILKDKLKGRDYMLDSKVILHSADLNPGNSGGPLLNEKGELVGINAYIRFNIEMMKFAIHADELISLLDKNGLSYLKGNIRSNDKSDSLINKNTDQGLLKTLDSLITGKGSLAKDSAAFLIKPLDSPDNTVFYILLFFGIGGLVFAVILYSGKKNKVRDLPLMISSLPETLTHNRNFQVSDDSALNNFKISYLLYNDRKIDLDDSEIIAGRDSKCDISISDNNLSRFHFKISCVNSNYIITDLGSKNGTFINGNKMNTKTLSNGDIISAGHNKILFRVS